MNILFCYSAFRNLKLRLVETEGAISCRGGSALLSANLFAFLVVLTFQGCKQEAASTPANPVPEVEVVEVVQKDIPIYSEWVGTTEGHVNAKIRAQVTGYLLRRPYVEGAFVKKGDLLFELDPSKFQVSFEQAKGDLAKAQAQLMKAKLDVERDKPLAKQGAISQKELDDSIQAYEAAKGISASAKAAVEQAKLNLEWTKVTAPIDGVAGIAQAQIGDLVDPNTVLTSISTLDPIRVYFSASEQEYMAAAEKISLRYEERSRDTRSAENRPANIEMILSDGTLYPHNGRFFLADRQVDVKTGTIRIAALFPNPGNILRPGQFARVRAVTRTREKALLVPQRAVTEMQGTYQVHVVTENNTVEIRAAKVGERAGHLWVIDEGVKAGERVVVEGLQKLKAGMTVNTKTYQGSAEAKDS
ncbi:MAG TPA: efflux RND transporter periplasmic adaptor subunit [Nitrospira sp.]|nr:efflux RND transporter periplasmic adaptor subunit [Nitrospira sp.]